MARRRQQSKRQQESPEIRLERALTKLSEASERRRQADVAMDRYAEEARKLGASWDVIGRAADFTGSGAMRRWKQ